MQGLFDEATGINAAVQGSSDYLQVNNGIDNLLDRANEIRVNREYLENAHQSEI